MKSNNKNTAIGLLAGLAVGAALGILFAPAKGTKTRKKIADNSKKTAQQIADSSKKTAAQLRDNVNEIASTVTSKVNELKEQGMKILENQKLSN